MRIANPTWALRYNGSSHWGSVISCASNQVLLDWQWAPGDQATAENFTLAGSDISVPWAGVALLNDSVDSGIAPVGEMTLTCVPAEQVTATP